MMSNQTTAPMTPRERVLAALHRQPVDCIPYCEHLVDARVGWQTAQMMRTPEEMEPVNQLLQEAQQAGPFGLFGMQARIEPALSRLLYRDNITYWGGASCFKSGTYLLNPLTPELGASADGVIKTRADLDTLEFNDIHRVVEDAKEFLKHKGDLAACALIFLGIDPCWHSMGFETFCIACIEEPELVGEFLGRITDWYAQAAEELCKLDFDFIWGADDIAFKTQPLVSPRTYRKVLLPHTRKVAAKITKPWIYHSDGNLLPIWDDLTSQGMNAIHPLEAGSMDLQHLKQTYGSRVSFVGGVDLRVLEAGTPEETRQETLRLIDILGPGGGYLLGASNSVTPYVKPENYRAMLETLLAHGRYPLGDAG